MTVYPNLNRSMNGYQSFSTRVITLSNEKGNAFRKIKPRVVSCHWIANFSENLYVCLLVWANKRIELSVGPSVCLSVSLTTTHCSFCLMAADLSVYTRSQCRKIEGHFFFSLSQTTASCVMCVPLMKGVQSPLLLVHPRSFMPQRSFTLCKSMFILD